MGKLIQEEVDEPSKRYIGRPIRNVLEVWSIVENESFWHNRRVVGEDVYGFQRRYGPGGKEQKKSTA